MIAPLRALLEEPRPSAPPPRPGRDRVLVGVVVALAVLEGLVREDLPVPVLSAVVTAGLAPLLLRRREHPFAVVAATFGTLAVVDVALLIAGSPLLDPVVLLWVLLLPYALLRWGSGREVVAGLAVVAVPATLSLVADWTGPTEALGGVAVLVAVAASGWAVRAQYAARERRLEQVRAAERVLLARDLHDTVAHHVSAIAVQAQAGRALAANDPASPLAALEVIEAEASRTLAEMRSMVGVLRAGAGADWAPQPGTADLARLAGSSPAGPRVEVSVAGDLSDLPAPIDAAVFRIAQEAVTNALRHSRGASLVDVRVVGEPSEVSVVVRDDGAPAAGAGTGTGFGLAGMTERALLLGGTCSAGPSPGGGWSVRATLPRQVPA